jgi:hypothetical protein
VILLILFLASSSGSAFAQSRDDTYYCIGDMSAQTGLLPCTSEAR